MAAWIQFDRKPPPPRVEPKKQGSRWVTYDPTPTPTPKPDQTSYSSKYVTVGIETFPDVPPKKTEKKKPFLPSNIRKPYYKRVWEITETNVPSLPNSGNRGKDHHVDHIVPISFGLRYGILPELIGSADNLRIVSREKNITKGDTLTAEAKAKIMEWWVRESRL